MKTLKPSILLLLLALVGSSHAQQRSVNIVFTDIHKSKSVDTVLTAGDEALMNLYAQYGLNAHNIHEINLDDLGVEWVSKGGAAKKVMIIESSEDVEIKNESGAQTKVKVMRIETDGDELTEEEMDALKQRMMNEHAVHGESSESNMVVEKRVFVEQHNDEERQEELKVEVKVENGVETIVAHRNGERLSDEEAKKLVDSKKMVSTQHNSEDLEIEVEENHFVSQDMEELEAIVIIKSIQNKTNGKNETAVQSEMNVYPNPATESIAAELVGVNGPYTIRLTNMAGLILIEENDDTKGQVKHRLQLNDLPKGTYVLSVDHSRGVQSTKVVIE